MKEIERMNRGLVAVKTNTGIFLSWRFFKREALGYSDTGLTGTDFEVYRDGELIATVADSTNYLDKEGTEASRYKVKPVGGAGEDCPEVSAFESGENYIDIPVKKPEGGVTPAGERFEYTLNDMSVGDINGDGEYEYIVKWDPTNSQDVSINVYTGRCIID